MRVCFWLVLTDMSASIELQRGDDEKLRSLVLHAAAMPPVIALAVIWQMWHWLSMPAALQIMQGSDTS